MRPVGEHEPSAERFLPLVERTFAGGIAVLLLLAALVPAPLELPADPAHPPNPAKSAWFLVWIQELVSWGSPYIGVAVLLALGLVALPWLTLPPLDHARWLPREHRALAVAVIAALTLVVALTVVGHFLRGPDWTLVSPF